MSSKAGLIQTFQEIGKNHDPVYAGICFFRIMVLEGLHQRIADHLWLHYMPFFASKLIDRAREFNGEDENCEFPTPLAYLLYKVVDTTAAWVRDADVLTKPGETVLRDHSDGNHVYISFEAAEAIGRVIQPILISPKVTDRLKLELLGVVLTSLRDLERRADLQPLATVLRENLINPYGLSAQKSYLHTLKEYIDNQDHVLLAERRRLRGELSAAIAAAS